MSLLSKVAALLKQKTVTATETYWRAARAIAGRGRDVDPLAVAEALPAVRKTEEDLEQDANLLVEEAQLQKQVNELKPSRAKSTAAGKRRAEAEAEAAQLEARAKRLREEADLAVRVAQSEEQNLRQAEGLLLNVQRKLRQRGAPDLPDEPPDLAVIEEDVGRARFALQEADRELYTLERAVEALPDTGGGMRRRTSSHLPDELEKLRATRANLVQQVDAAETRLAQAQKQLQEATR